MSLPREPTKEDGEKICVWLRENNFSKQFRNIHVRGAVAKCFPNKDVDCMGRHLVNLGLAVEDGVAGVSKLYTLVGEENRGDLALVSDVVQRAAKPEFNVEVKPLINPSEEEEDSGVVEKVVEREKIVEVDTTKKKIEAECRELEESLKILDAKHQAIVKEFNEKEVLLKAYKKILL